MPLPPNAPPGARTQPLEPFPDGTEVATNEQSDTSVLRPKLFAKVVVVGGLVVVLAAVPLRPARGSTGN